MRMNEELEIRRMLECFKAQLPRHDLGDWAIEAQPVPPSMLIEGEQRRLGMAWSSSWTRFRIKGHATCQRCGARFYIPNIGNALAVDEEGIPGTVERMKEWVERDADKPCWGDVPEVRDNSGPVPVLDTAMKDREVC